MSPSHRRSSTSVHTSDTSPRATCMSPSRQRSSTSIHMHSARVPPLAGRNLATALLPPDGHRMRVPATMARACTLHIRGCLFKEGLDARTVHKAAVGQDSHRTCAGHESRWHDTSMHPTHPERKSNMARTCTAWAALQTLRARTRAKTARTRIQGCQHPNPECRQAYPLPQW